MKTISCKILDLRDRKLGISLIILVIWDNPFAARALVSRLGHLETPLVSVSHEAMDNYPLRITKCAIDGRLRK